MLVRLEKWHVGRKASLAGVEGGIIRVIREYIYSDEEVQSVVA